MKTITTIISLFFLLPLFVHAQINYEPGFIITSEGDEVEGFLKSTNPKKIGEKVTFKAGKSATPTVYYPGDIKGFKYTDGRYYVTKEVTIDTTTKNHFLEFLLEGEANLYFYIDKRGQHFFIERNNLVELEVKKEKVKVKNTTYLKKSDVFRETLRKEFADSEKIQKNILTVPFDHDSLIDITVKYHNDVCLDENKECTIYRKDTRNQFFIGFEADQYASRLNFIPMGAFTNWGGDETVMTGPMKAYYGKLAISHLFGFKQGTLLHVGLGYSSTALSYARYDITHENIIVPIYITHRFWSNDFSPFVRAGIKNYIMLDQSIYDKLSDEESILTGMMEAYQIGGQLGAGFQYEKDRVSISISGTSEFRSMIIQNPWRNGNGKLLSDLVLAYGLNVGLQVRL
ncbi:MAG: hypothetical protein KDE26_24470 [Bacteroidetes bacterium]|nr:hypothetical protein [Bacteroidota bacterium]